MALSRAVKKTKRNAQGRPSAQALGADLHRNGEKPRAAATPSKKVRKCVRSPQEKNAVRSVSRAAEAACGEHGAIGTENKENNRGRFPPFNF
ncbi:hypothetical protein NDU88_006007 [Pleurodeles waltl]|uniref:Uncharacterized protein n=1 Tax=Pleurodeles waltl TaxID=8319 RepID=A0AAV7TX69_PLEWA|nr:hypothetical protein NDU88_006007 [Pleurodeles waltl]